MIRISRLSVTVQNDTQKQKFHVHTVIGYQQPFCEGRPFVSEPIHFIQRFKLIPKYTYVEKNAYSKSFGEFSNLSPIHLEFVTRVLS